MRNAILVIIFSQILCFYQLNGQTIAAGYKHSLFIKSDGSLWGMGDNGGGQIGLTDSITNYEPVKLSDSGIMEVYANYWNSFYLKADGSLWASGESWSKEPMEVVDSGVSKVSIGSGDLYYIKNDKTLWAKYSQRSDDELVASDVALVASGWGASAWGSGALYIGNNGSLSSHVQTSDDSSQKIEITSGFTRVVSAAIGEDVRGYVMEDGSLWEKGWEDSDYKKIVDSAVVKVVAGEGHLAFIKDDGSLWAKGSNSDGQLGDGTIVDRDMPVKMVDSEVVDISSCESHTLFLKADGTLWGTGLNEWGQLGDGTKTNRLEPIKIADGVMLPTGSTSAEVSSTLTPQGWVYWETYPWFYNDGTWYYMKASGSQIYAYSYTTEQWQAMPE